jgi:hypothetical protein
LLNVNIPDKSTTRPVDGLLFLPTGLAVLEGQRLHHRAVRRVGDPAERPVVGRR